jgi:hypothetical protein
MQQIFFIKENLKRFHGESVTIKLVLYSRYYFIQYGHNDKLHHQPTDQNQYNFKASLTSSFHFPPAKQKKLHKLISTLLVSMHVDCKDYNWPQEFELEVVYDAVTSKVLAGLGGEYTELDRAKGHFFEEGNRFQPIDL